MESKFVPVMWEFGDQWMIFLEKNGQYSVLNDYMILRYDTLELVDCEPKDSWLFPTFESILIGISTFENREKTNELYRA